MYQMEQGAMRLSMRRRTRLIVAMAGLVLGLAAFSALANVVSDVPADVASDVPVSVAGSEATQGPTSWIDFNVSDGAGGHEAFNTSDGAGSHEAFNSATE